jgi:hypothetical protein
VDAVNEDVVAAVPVVVGLMTVDARRHAVVRRPSIRKPW